MIQNPLKKTTPIESFFIIVIIVLLMVFSIFLIRNIQSVHRTGVFQSHAPISELLLKNKQTNQTSIKDIEYIDIWMTFSYINFIFDIREDYLKNELSITDSHYPNLPIGRYIKSKNLDKAAFIKEVKGKVSEYMSLHSVK